MHDRLDDLFRKANVAYVIPRDINATWLTTLPSLPHGLDWTLLLLQEVLDKYPAIGFKSISPDLNQTLDTLAAAFVPVDSPLQTFPDVVTLFMEEHHDLPMRMPGEDLRLELRDAGMLENGEMIYALPKALNDYCLAVPAKPDKRDLTAIKRLCTAFVKLLYPNATCKDDIPADEFIKYCLEPAKEMRGVIKKQLCIIDPKEFNVPGKKDIPDIQYNYM